MKRHVVEKSGINTHSYYESYITLSVVSSEEENQGQFYRILFAVQARGKGG